MTSFDVAPHWDGHTATLDAYEERVKLYIMSTKRDEKCLCGPRLLARFEPESDAFRIVREQLTDAQLTAEDGSGGTAIIAAPHAARSKEYAASCQLVPATTQAERYPSPQRRVDEEVDDAVLPLAPQSGGRSPRRVQRNPSQRIPAPDDPGDPPGGNERAHSK